MPAKNFHEARIRRQLFLILLPSMLLLLAFVIYPAVYSVYLSFTNEALTGAGALNPRFVGIRNYTRLLNDTKFWNSLLVTFLFVLGSAIIGQFVLGLVSAMALGRSIRFRKIFASIILLPNAAPEVVAGFMWISMLAGGEQATLSRIVASFGVEPSDWLNTFPLAMIIVVNTWRGIATAMILLTAGLSTIPGEIYEAARMDGATPMQTFRRITLPLMMPTILLYMLISAVSTIAVFGLVYALTRGGPGGATELISIYIYNQSFTAYQLGYGAAVAVVVLLISIVIGVGYVKAMKVEV
ncbi:carbohydrate ABC transporter permease [Rhizobium rhizogenes]|uniref:carbohydrate ABC transporter permease n=1 Tax=Rhizobium rhizogenes TaxID=359 RepID=UPI00226E8059|nr:sugar ABC transporter permease [Rhizobium rhizogenes]